MARKYYYPGEASGLLTQVRNRLFRKRVPAFPKTIVVETQFGCNAGCVFCQYPQLKDKLPRGRMDDALFEKIARECAGRNVERFILCLDNEPLLDRTLARKFRLLQEHCPGSARNLTTNASLLTLPKVEELIGSGAVTELFLSVNGYTKETYEALMKLDFDRTMESLNSFCAWLRAHPDIRRNLRVRVNVVATRRVEAEVPLLRQRWQKQEGFELHVIRMDNRGSQLDLRRDHSLSADQADMRPNTACRRPFHTLVITWEGDVVICCVDYRREVKIGNVNTESLSDIWSGERFTQLRKEYLAGVFDHLRPCRTCKVKS